MPVAKSAAAAPRIVCRPLTPERWDDLAALFGPKGACANCWCMFFRSPAAAFHAGTRDAGAGNRRALRRVVAAGPPPGLLAYRGRTPVGWCAVAPREAYPRLQNSRVMGPVDDRPAWSVTCFFVAREARRQGVTRALLDAAAAFAARHGARWLEAYPVDARGRQPDAFVYHGLAAMFHDPPWREIARRSPTRPVMRRALRATARARAAGPRG